MLSCTVLARAGVAEQFSFVPLLHSSMQSIACNSASQMRWSSVWCRQAAKEASKKNQGSVTGDFAQPLTRRHSRSSSGCLSRGASLRLDGDWLTSPAKSTHLSDLQTPHEQDAEHGEVEVVKKDS